MDKEWSFMISKENRLSIELPLIVFAHVFNRAIIVIPFSVCILVGFFRYDTWMEAMGYKLPPPNVAHTSRFLLGLAFMIFYAIFCVMMVITTTAFKKLIKRPRPPMPDMIYAKRMNNLRAKEVGTYAMPSGDSAACALFCYLMAVQMRVQAIYLILPLVCLGRVYYHCHWIGDTIVGSIIGTLWGVLGCGVFWSFVPLMQLIGGKDFFLSPELTQV